MAKKQNKTKQNRINNRSNIITNSMNTLKWSTSKNAKKMEKARKWALPSTVWREHDPAHTVVLADGNDCRLLASRNVKE